MANSVIQQPRLQPAAETARTTADAAPITPNDRAASTASVERRRRAAAAVPPVWRTALGGLLPPEALGPARQLALRPPAIAQLRADVYRLTITATAGFEQAQQYLDAAEIDSRYQDALRAIGQAARGDRTTLSEIRTAVALVSAGNGGDLSQATQHVLHALATTSDDGKQYLRHNDNNILTPLRAFLDNASHFPDPQSAATKARRASFEALWTALHTAEPAVHASPAAAPAAPVSFTKAQAAAGDKLIASITSQFPAGAPGQVLSQQIAPAQLTALRADIDRADPRVRDYVYAWRGADGRGVLQLLGSHLSPRQVQEVSAHLDGVERLYDELERSAQDDPTGPAAIKLVHDFVAAHLGDKATRDRVRDDAPLMQHYINKFPDAARKPIIRMIIAGHEAPDAVDKVHDAADAGDSLAAVSAIYELGQTPGRLQALRGDLVFVHRLQDKCNKQVAWHGLQIKPYDLFLQLAGVDPHQTKEAGAADRQTEIDPSAQLKALTAAEQVQLEAEVYNPFSKPLADELNSWLYVNDTTVMTLLHKFAAAAASHSDLLRRARQAPGPELARRIQAHGCDVRLKLQRGLAQENLTQAERILGFATDQATVGVIGGAGTLAADTKHVDAGKVPLEQALRETMIGGAVLAEVIHGKAAELADELGRWFGARADHVRAIWQSYSGTVDAKVCAQLRDRTGLARVWAIELLANAFVQVGGGTLQSRVQQALGKEHNDVITQMGLQPTDLAARRTLAETKAVQDNSNEAANTQQLSAAHAVVEQVAKADSFRAPAAALFKALSHLHIGASDHELTVIGTQLTADLAMASVAPAAAKPAAAAHRPVVAPAAAASVDHGATDFASFYQREYGIDPRRHAVEIAKSLAGAHDPVKVGALLGVHDPSLFIAPKPAANDGLEITEANRTLVGPDFTINDAKARAQKMWDLLHGDGTVQLIRAQYDGRTPEEQRLIKVAFRRLSGGIDLTFYFQQASSAHPERGDVVVGGARVSGSAAETALMLEVAQHGKVSLESRISASITANNMDDVYAAIEGASPDDRRGILANDALMTKLRKFGDDSYEWNRIYKGLAGDSDLFDRLESRAHGRHGIIGGFEGTDEKGMSSDIATYAKQRKAAIRAQLIADKLGGKEPADPRALDSQVTAQLKVEFGSLAENPSIRALLHDELSGAELSNREGMLMAAGEQNKAASALTEHDWTEDEEKIIADIKAMTPAERKALRENPEYIEQLRKDIQTQATWRDAMIALGSDHDGSTGAVDDNYGALEKAARTSREDTTELVVEYNDVIQALSKLTPAEYQRLQRDARLQTQILAALQRHPEQLALARQMMAFNSANAGAMTGLTIADPDHPADPAKGVYTQSQVERIAFLKFGAINRLRAGASRSWAMLLQASIAVYELQLKPSDSATPEAPPNAADAPAAGASSGPAPQTPQAAGTPEVATAATAQHKPAGPHALDPATASGGEAAIDARLRHEILDEVAGAIAAATTKWGNQDAADGAAPERHELNPSQQQTLIAAAVMHSADPSDALLAASTGTFNDADRVKDTIRRASDDVLVREWTTVVHKAPNGNDSLGDRYAAWKAARPADAKPNEQRAPRVGSPEWNARTAFKAFVLDTSDAFEDLLLHYSGGMFDDNKRLARGSTEIRDNPEWLEWRSLVRDRIPTLDRKKIGTAIGAAGDPEAMAVVENPTLSNALGSLAYDDERYQLDRGEHSNYNIDRVTAGGKGVAEDNAMADYRREVLTSVTSSGAGAGEDYGTITAEEQARIAGAKERFSKSTTEFRAAKAAVANVAAAVIGLLIMAVVTVLTAGLATGPLTLILLGALSAGTASVAQNTARKTIQGTDFDFGKDGLHNIARDTVMGAVTAGSTWYASRMATGLFDVSSAAEQAALVANVARDQTFFTQLGKAMTEQSVQNGLQGVFDTGTAAFDPAMWMDGWHEGVVRAGSAARERAGEVPVEMMRAAVLAAMTHSANLGIGKAQKAFGKQPVGPGTAEEAEAITDNNETQAEEAATGMSSFAARTKEVATVMATSAKDGVIMAVGQDILDEATWRAEGPKPGDLASHIGASVMSMMSLAGNTINTGNVIRVQRARLGALELARHRGELTDPETNVYAELVLHGNDPSVLSIPAFKQIRAQQMSRAVADAPTLLDADIRRFEAHCRAADTLAEFHARVAEGPIPAREQARAQQRTRQALADIANPALQARYVEPPDLAGAMGRARAELAATAVRKEDGTISNSLAELEASELSNPDKELVVRTMARAMYFLDTVIRPGDAGMADATIKHTLFEVAQTLDAAQRLGLPPTTIGEALRGTIYTDMDKVKEFAGPHNSVLTHNQAGREAAAVYEARNGSDIRTIGRIAESVEAHQVGPPGIMASLMGMALTKKLGTLTEAQKTTLKAIQAKVSAPLDPANQQAGGKFLAFEPDELALLAELGIQRWSVPTRKADFAIIAGDTAQYHNLNDFATKYVGVVFSGPDGMLAPYLQTLHQVEDQIFGAKGSGSDAIRLLPEPARVEQQRQQDVAKDAIKRVDRELDAWLHGQGHDPATTPGWGAPLTAGDPTAATDRANPATKAFYLEMKAEYIRRLRAAQLELNTPAATPPSDGASVPAADT